VRKKKGYEEGVHKSTSGGKTYGWIELKRGGTSKEKDERGRQRGSSSPNAVKFCKTSRQIEGHEEPADKGKKEKKRGWGNCEQEPVSRLERDDIGGGFREGGEK